MITIHRIDTSAFDAIAAEWNHFVHTSSNDTIFLTHEWLTAWWDAFKTITAKDDLQSYLNDYYQLVQQRHNWTPSEAREAFLASLCEKLVTAGWLRCYLLVLNNVPTATQFGFCYNKKYYCYKAAFNPAFSALSPGKALFEFALHNEIDLGSTEMDFLIGEYTYKGYWCNEIREVDYIEIVANRLASRFKVLLVMGSWKLAKGIQAARNAVKKRLPAILQKSKA